MSIATIGSALAERRAFLGLEKGQAADKIGMSRTTYSSYEQDAQRPSVDVFPALAGFLEISMEELLTLYGATCVAAIRPSLERLLSTHDQDDSETESSTKSELVIELGAAPQSETPIGSAVDAFPESLPTPSPAEPEVLESSSLIRESETPIESASDPFSKSLPTPSPAEPEVLESHNLHDPKEPERSPQSETPKETAANPFQRSDPSPGAPEPKLSESHNLHVFIEPERSPQSETPKESSVNPFQRSRPAPSPAEPEAVEPHNLHVLRESERSIPEDRPSVRREELTSWLDRQTHAKESTVSGSVVFEPSPFVIRSSTSELRGKDPDEKKKKKKKKKKK